MHKRRKWLINISVFLLLVFASFIAYENTFLLEASANWGFNVTRPSKILLKINTLKGFLGQGKKYVVAQYGADRLEKVESLKLWQRIDGHANKVLNDHIQLASSYFAQNRAANPLKEKPLEITQKSLFYFKEKDDGSFFIAVLNTEKQKLYVLEWMQ